MLPITPNPHECVLNPSISPIHIAIQERIALTHTTKKKFFFMADCISKKPMELTLGFEPRTYFKYSNINPFADFLCPKHTLFIQLCGMFRILLASDIELNTLIVFP